MTQKRLSVNMHTIMKRQTKRLLDRVHNLLLRSSRPLTEKSLASKFRVSRTPVREVIKHLEMEGIIVSGRNRGITFRPWQMEEIGHLYEIRALLEGYAASQAVKHMTERDFRTLYRLSRLYQKAREKGKNQQAFTLDQRFHEKILLKAENRYLFSLMQKIRLIYSSMYLRNRYYPSPSDINPYTHEKIADALARRNSRLAASLMKKHILWSGKTILQWLRKHKSSFFL